MKRKYREAMRAQLRLQDSYVDGASDDEQAVEARDWHDDCVPVYEPKSDHHLDDNTLPF